VSNKVSAKQVLLDYEWERLSPVMTQKGYSQEMQAQLFGILGKLRIQDALVVLKAFRQALGVGE